MLRSGQAIACCVLALLTIGVVMVNSADMSLDAEKGISFESILLSRSTAYMVLALLAMGICSWLPIRAWAERVSPGTDRTSGPLGTESTDGVSPLIESAGNQTGRDARSTRRSNWLLSVIGPPKLWIGVGLILAALATVYVPGVGRSINGSHRWLEIPLPGLGKLSLQPSEIAKWSLVVLIAWYASTRRSQIGSFWRGLLPGLAATGVVAAFVVVEDLGTGVLLGAAACIILLAAGAKLWHMLLLAPPALAMLALAVLSSPYRMKRMTAFLDPYADPEKTGFHMIQSMAAVANGEITGRGLGHGLQKFGYLPEDRTDFLFAVICEELGIVGAGLVVALYLGLLLAGLSVIRRERSPMLKLIGLGILSTIGLQAVINLAVVTGLGPTKGIALPLLSSGGTGWILTAASLGLIMAMDRGQAREQVADKSPTPSPALVETL